MTIVSTLAAAVLVSLAIATPTTAPTYKVSYIGAQRNVMIKRDFRAHIGTASLATVPHLYALGPSEGLNHEITFYDGDPHTSRAIASANGIETVTVERAYPKAAFLVWSSVATWQAVPIPARVQTQEALETFVGAAAKKAGLRLGEAFPFRVKGIVQALDWHIVRDGQHVNFENRNLPAHILGFYSSRHHGVFTHQGTNIHLHFTTPDRSRSGHIDNLTLTRGAVLYLPKP